MESIRNWNDPWDTTPHAALQGFSSIIPTVYGRMIVNRYDTAQVVPLLRSGFSLIHGEVRFLGRVLSCLEPNGLVVVDVGANIGVVTLALAKLVGSHGKIHAFEPQRIILVPRYLGWVETSS